jgi:hypothetical protein
VQQHASRCLIDLLTGGDQDGASAPDGQGDRHVIGPVSGEAVKLVKHDVVDAAITHSFQESLEPRTVSRACGRSRVDELLDTVRTQFLDLARAGPALRRYRVALDLAVPRDLLARRSPVRSLISK